MMPLRGLVRLTAVSLIGLAILVGLGVWQLQRLEWKEALIARIDARTKAKPIGLDKAIAIAKERRNPSYYRVRVEGRFHHDKERYLYAIGDGKPGWHVITPLETVNGDMVLIDRGFVPYDLKEPAGREAGQVESVVAMTGILRTPEIQTVFTPDNEPQANRWFWRDLGGMARSMFPDGTVQIAPFFLEAEASDVPGGWPKGGQTQLVISNNHLQYALTWFSLALVLIVIYTLYVRKISREGRGLSGA